MDLSLIIYRLFVFNFLTKVKPNYIVAILAFILFIRFFYITFGIGQYNSRLQELELTLNKMEEKGETKMIFHQDPHTRRAFHLDWGLPVESLTLSTIRGDKPLRTFKVMAQEEIRAVSKDTFISSFRFMNYKELNPRYYMIDTTEAYQVSDFDKFIRK